MSHLPQYKISGPLRKQKKKELGEKKTLKRYSSHINDVSKVYGMGFNDRQEEEFLFKLELEIIQLEVELAERL